MYTRCPENRKEVFSQNVIVRVSTPWHQLRYTKIFCKFVVFMRSVLKSLVALTVFKTKFTFGLVDVCRDDPATSEHVCNRMSAWFRLDIRLFVQQVFRLCRAYPFGLCSNSIRIAILQNTCTSHWSDISSYADRSPKILRLLSLSFC